MELTIKESTYTLKEINSARRESFVSNILSYYNYESKNFDDFIKETKAALEKNHSIIMSSEKVKSSFLVQYQKKICHCIWEFLKPQDKKDFSSSDNLKIPQEDLKRFIEWGSKKIKDYADYVKNNCKGGGTQNVNLVHSYLARTYGWTLEYIKEMDELELLKSIESAVDINQTENINQINSQALAGAYSSGSKKAKSTIDSMNRKERSREYQKSNPNLEIKNPITKDQFQKIMDNDRGGEKWLKKLKSF